MNEDASVYLTTQEAADLLHCSRSLLERNRERRDDLPPYVRIGGSVRYRLADIEAWADAQARRNGAKP